MPADLFHRTRNRSYLWRTSLVLLAVFVAVAAWVGRQAVPGDGALPASRLADNAAGSANEFAVAPGLDHVLLRRLQRCLQESADFNELIFVTDLVARSVDDPARVIRAIAQASSLTDAQRLVLATLAQGTEPAGGTATSPDAGLLQLAAVADEVPEVGAAQALLLDRSGDLQGALAAAQSALTATPSPFLREWMVRLCFKAGFHDELHALATRADFADYIGWHELWSLAIAQRDWREVARLQIPAAYESVDLASVLLTLATGSVWVVLLLRLAGANGFRVAMTLPALLLGALSAHATVIVILLQETHLGWLEGGGVLRQIAYMVAGVGLREEVLKLLFFLPLLACCRRHQDDLTLLLLASMVGLGFAIEENVGYFQESGGIEAIGRFVTANFLHISLTGLVGLAWGRAVFEGGDAWAQALNMLGLAVLLHGAYDALIHVPELEEFSLFAMTAFVLAGRFYFACLRQSRPQWRDAISATAVFTWGIITVIGLTLVAQAQEAGFVAALESVGTEFFGVGIVMFMFYQGIPESIA